MHDIKQIIIVTVIFNGSPIRFLSQILGEIYADSILQNVYMPSNGLLIMYSV